MKKKLLSLLLALVMCLGLLPTAALAAGDFAIANGVLVWYKGPGGDVVIPREVTAIGEKAFENCTNLTSVTIPDSVTTIGNHAFYRCTNLVSVTIPVSVTSIGDFAFYLCGNLTSATIGDGVTAIGESAFAGCKSLTSVTLGKNLTTIGGSAFRDCSKLTDIIIPGSVTTFGEYAFMNCYNLDSVTIQEGVTTIGKDAFWLCSSLNSVTIPDSVTTIGRGAFNSCESLTRVTIGNGVTTVDAYAFYLCNGLTSVTIPDSVTTIGDGAFNKCSSLTDVYYGGDEKMWGNINIQYTNNRELAAATIHYGEEAPVDSSPFTIKDGVLTSYTGSDADVTVPNTVTTVAAKAFSNLQTLRSVTLPNSVTEVKSDAFYNCGQLERIVFSPNMSVLNNSVFYISNPELFCSLKEVTIPAGIIIINDRPFALMEVHGESGNMVNVPGLTVHGAKNSAAEYWTEKPGSFQMYSYTFVADQNHIASSNQNAEFEIVDGALRKITTGSDTLVIPEGVTKIWSSAFDTAYGVKNVTLPSTLKTVNLSLPYVEKLTISPGTTEVELDCPNLTDLTLQGGLAELKLDLPKLTTLTIQGEVKSLNLNCPELTNVPFPAGLEKLTLTSNAITHLVIPEGVKEAYLNCPELVELSLPSTLTQASGLFPEKVEKITFAEGCPLYYSNSFQTISKLLDKARALDVIVNNPSRTLTNHMAANDAIRDAWKNPTADPEGQTAKVRAKAKEICAGITDEYEKAKAISQWVTDHIEYDYDYFYAGLKDYSDVPFNPDEVLDSGLAVCAGYARLTQALLEAQGIPCLYVLGWTTQGYHAWNLALVDDEYIWLDSTWGIYYFDMGSARFALDHVSQSAAKFDNVLGPGSVIDVKVDTATQKELEAERQETVNDVPTITSTGVNPAESGQSYAATQSVNIGGKAVEFQMYALKNEYNEPTNYVKLRDLAAALDGTAAQFNVVWSAETGVGIETGKAYTSRNGQEGKTPYSGDRAYQKGAATTQVNGVAVPLQAFVLTDDNGGQSTYYKLRDLGQALGFNVGWSAEKGVFVEPDKAYDPAN